MDASADPHPEFDPPPARSVRLRDFDPLEGQRLVVNPFLATFALIVWWEAARWLLHSLVPTAVRRDLLPPRVPALSRPVSLS